MATPRRGRAASRSWDKRSNPMGRYRRDFRPSGRGLGFLGRDPFRSLDRLQSVLFHLVVAW